VDSPGRHRRRGLFSFLREGMVMIGISVRTNLKQLQSQLTAIARKQVPFAAAQAINLTAARVKAAETENIGHTFKSPTPFTQNSVAIRRATKGNPVAIVFVKDIAAKYMRPYETGGVHVLPGKALLDPKNIALNSYGQLPRGTIEKLKGRPDVFIGAVRLKNGETINGIWQRPTDTKRVTLLNGRGKRLGKLNRMKRTDDNPRGKLKLLIRFGDALPVQKQLNYGEHAQTVVNRYLARDFEVALQKAMATAK
jgi:hypothetical protein